MKLMKANTTIAILVKTIVLLLVFNMIAPNFLILRDMIPSLDLWLFIYILTEIVICGISFFIGLEIKRKNIDIIKCSINSADNRIRINLIILISSIILNIILFYQVPTPYVDENLFHIERYVDHFCNGFFLVSVAFGVFAVLGTASTSKYLNEQIIKTKRKNMLKKLLIYTSPITIICCIYLVYIYSYKLSINDLSYINVDTIASIHVEYTDNYNNIVLENYYENNAEITEIMDKLVQYTFKPSINTFVPNASVMSQSNVGNSIGRDRIFITIIYKNYDENVEYINLLQDGRIQIHNIKGKSTYAASKDDANLLFAIFNTN